MEQLALAAFGISWLVASEVFPVVTRPDERTVLPTFIVLTEEMARSKRKQRNQTSHESRPIS